MKTKKKKFTNIVPGSKSFLIFIMILWTLIITISLVWNFSHIKNDIVLLAESRAEVSYAKDIIYRDWHAKRGGEYAPVTTQKDLTKLPNNKIIAKDLSENSLLNNNTLSQKNEYQISKNKLSQVSHITCINPINPKNTPDEWEEKALNMFQNGAEKLTSIIEVDGEEYLRFMKPFITKESCIKCHGQQGYKLGDIRGGVSLAIPLNIFDDTLSAKSIPLFFAHFLLWLSGVGFVYLGTQIVRKKIKELKESEERIRDITISSNDWIWEVDANGRYTFVSGNTEHLLGLTKKELLGKTPFDLMTLDEKKRVTEIFISLKNNKEAIKNLENWNVKKNGEEVCWLTNAVPLLDENKNLIGYRGIDKDITEEKRAESKIRHLQKMESIGTLAAGIAHEINTPAQFINDNLAFLKDAYSDVKPLLEFSARAKENSISIRELKELTKDVDLNYLKVEIPSAFEQSIEGLDKVSKIIGAMRDYAHAGPKEKVSADIHKVIENSLTLSRATWKYFANIEKTYDDTLPPIICQASELNQVFINMMVNASHALEDKYKDSEKIEGVIKIETIANENSIAIIISDNGKGMPEKVKDRIFDPFFTTKEVGKGTGQGLAIAYDIIVNKHNGSLEVESEENVGTKFTISLPTKVVTNLEQVEEPLL